MRKVLRSALVILTALMFSLPSYAKIPAVCRGINLSKHLPMPPYKILLEKDRYGMCEMILWINGNFVPVFATKNFVMSGDMWSYRVQVTQADIDEAKGKIFKQKNIQNLFKSLAVAVLNPNAKKYLVYFTDPNDENCNVIARKITKLARKYHFGVYVIFIPIQTYSRATVETFICTHKTYNDFINQNYGDQNKYCTKADRYLAEVHNLYKLGIDGVPEIVGYNGNFAEGSAMGIRTILSTMGLLGR